MNIRFSSPFDAKPGTLEEILSESYRALLEDSPSLLPDGDNRWKDFESSVFDNPTTIGSCSFISWIGDEPIGFFSYDPRQRTSWIIGQNCIIPKFRGKGLGRMQIQEILDRCKKRGVGRVTVTTCDHPFFLPAHRMYASCQFSKVATTEMAPNSKWRLVELERKISENRSAHTTPDIAPR